VGVIQVPGYRMVRALGRGGMGSVFLAEKASTGEPFAIKFLRQDCMEDPAYLARFEREVTSLRSIRHPNVVNVYAWSIPASLDTDERPFVIMEYLEGDGLDKVLAKEKKLAPLTATRIMLQVLDGLAAAHQIGVVHRDLGPSNIFLMPRQRGRFHVKILDFGLARSLSVTAEESELTQQGTLMGKPAYVAPEALTGQPIDGRSDIFACGILMFRMLAGSFPYKEADSHLLWVERLRDARSETEYPPPSSVVPDIPQALDRITSKAMRVRAADRYPTVEAMQEDLLEVETTLVGETTSRADWSTSRPGIPSLLDAPSRSGVQPRLRGSSVDATPTAGPVAPAATVVRNKRLIVGAAAMCGAALAVALFVLLRGGGTESTGDARLDVGGTLVAAVPESDAADAGAAAPDVPVAPAADAVEKPDAAAVKVVEPDIIDATLEVTVDVPADAGPPMVVVVIHGLPRFAHARIGDVELTGDPPQGVVPAAAEAELVVEARGFVPYREKLALEQDRELTVRLRRVSEPPPPPRDGGRHIPSVVEDAF
jgi:serine/threonine protein kinase